jgi:hypothetical protein
MRRSNKQITIDNLKIVLEGFLKNKDIEFDIRRYGVYNYRNREEILNDKCDSCGCLLGHSVKFFSDVIDDKGNYFFNDYNNHFDYDSFSRKKFPYLYKNGKDLWDFLFHYNWNYCQPSLKEGISRIKYALKHDLEIGKWEYQKKQFK